MKLVTCPDCGRQVAPRGLPNHQRDACSAEQAINRLLDEGQVPAGRLWRRLTRIGVPVLTGWGRISDGRRGKRLHAETRWAPKVAVLAAKVCDSDEDLQRAWLAGPEELERLAAFCLLGGGRGRHDP